MTLKTAPFDAALLREQMGKPLDSLQFDEPLERAMVVEIWEAQRRSAIFTLIFMTCVWLAYMGLDVWRYQQLTQVADQQIFFLGVVVGRLVVLSLFASAWLAMLHGGLSDRARSRWMLAAILGCSTVILLSSYTLRSLGLPETSHVMLLAVVVTLAPLGLRVRDAAPVAMLSCLVSMVMGPLILQERAHLIQHWTLMVIMMVTLVFCLVTAYFRERAQREQFLMRKLLDWEASHDPMTGLPNRRLFREHFKRALAHARREGLNSYLAIVDVDYFKLYNDRYGHQAGDEVLCRLASILNQYARRPLDLAVRLGGEEFALLMVDEEVVHVAERMSALRTEVVASDLQHEPSPIASHVTISIGVAEVLPDDTLDTVFSVADALLYEAKAQGRNKVRAWLNRREQMAEEGAEKYSPTPLNQRYASPAAPAAGMAEEKQA